jgi:hypothetical protein
MQKAKFLLTTLARSGWGARNRRIAANMRRFSLYGGVTRHTLQPVWTATDLLGSIRPPRT